MLGFFVIRPQPETWPLKRWMCDAVCLTVSLCMSVSVCLSVCVCSMSVCVTRYWLRGWSAMATAVADSSQSATVIGACGIVSRIHHVMHCFSHHTTQ